MASAHWRTGHSVATLIQQPDVGWDFFQLIRVLLAVQQSEDNHSEDKHLLSARGSQSSTSESHARYGLDLLEKINRNISFRASLASDFAPATVRQIHAKSSNAPREVTLSNGALETQDGPLPESFVSWIRQLESQGDSAMADFFNLFTNRFVALRYLIGSTVRPSLTSGVCNNSKPVQLMKALMGFSPDAHDMGTGTHDLHLELAGLLSNTRRSLPVIRQLLSCTLGLPLIEMRALKGGWLRVDSQDHTHLSHGSPKQSTLKPAPCPQSRATGVLGQNATLGKRIWDQQKSIELKMGPVNWKEVCEWVPGGSRHDELFTVLKRITDGKCDTKVTFVCPVKEIPLSRLSSAAEPSTTFSLGLTSVLKRSPTTVYRNPASTERSKPEHTEWLNIGFTMKTAL